VKTRKKALLIAVSVILVVAATTFATLAYLTSELTVTHTFTIGDVEVNLTIDNQSKLMFNNTTVQDGEARKLVPNYEYEVPVNVHIGDASEDAWVFAHVINPFEDVEAASGTQTLSGSSYKTIAEQMAANSWTPLTYNGAVVDDVYYFNNTASAEGHVVTAGSTLQLYSHFKLSQNAKGGTVAEALADLNEDAEDGETVTLSAAEQKLYLGEYKDKHIMVIVYVVQADGLEDADAAWSVFEAQYLKNVNKYAK